MSTANAFVALGNFPWCPQDEDSFYIGLPGSTFVDYVDDVTLSNASAFLWNLEKFYITFSGSATVSGNTTNASGHAAMDEAATGNGFDASPWDRGASLNNAWFANVSANTAWASWPSIKQPNERVCIGPGLNDHGDFLVVYGDNSGNGNESFSMFFALGTDPGNVGKFRIYYQNLFKFKNGNGPELTFGNPQWVDGVNVFASGTYAIGPITFAWDASSPTANSASGLSMSATSGLFTY